MPVIEENTGFIYCVEVNLDDVVVSSSRPLNITDDHPAEGCSVIVVCDSTRQFCSVTV